MSILLRGPENGAGVNGLCPGFLCLVYGERYEGSDGQGGILPGPSEEDV